MYCVCGIPKNSFFLQIFQWNEKVKQFPNTVGCVNRILYKRKRVFIERKGCEN